jgi:hypothetical protein
MGHRMIALRLLVALVAIVALAGCTAAPAPSPTPTTRSLAQEEPERVELSDGTVVATGALASVDGRTSGEVTITADGSRGFTIGISRFASPVSGEVILNTSTEPFTEEAYCAEGFSIYVQGHLTLAPEMTIALGFDDLTFGNPAYLDTIVLTLNAIEPRTGCFYPVVATAPLTWTMPDLRPDIRVIDSGETGGATGWVTAADGRPVSYMVARDDLLPEIAARFGLTVADLLYLNPARNTSGDPRSAYVDEVFNLDKAAR